LSRKVLVATLPCTFRAKSEPSAQTAIAG